MRTFFDIWKSKKAQNPAVIDTFDFQTCFAPQRRSTSKLPKVVREWRVFYILTWKCRATTASTFSTSQLPKVRWCGVLCTFWLGNALRATTACTFLTSISKSGPKLECLVHFDLKMCFAPLRRALFWHLNFQKWSEVRVSCTFRLGNVLRTTTACTFSTSQLLKAVRGWGVLYIFASKCASRHNGVQFFISHLASWLRTRRFSEPTFRPARATNHWKKHSESRLPYLFAYLDLLSSHSFSSLLFSLLGFSSLTLPTSVFSSVHIVGSLISKLPSINTTIYIYIDISSHILQLFQGYG